MHDLDHPELLDRGPDIVDQAGRGTVAEGGVEVDHGNLVRHVPLRLSRTRVSPPDARYGHRADIQYRLTTIHQESGGPGAQPAWAGASSSWSTPVIRMILT